MTKHAVFAALGDFYGDYDTGYKSLKFVYKNVSDLIDFLDANRWTNHIPLIDDCARKADILTMLEDIIRNAKEDDWLLFYFTGHGNKFFLEGPQNGESVKHYCVTFDEKLKFNFLPKLATFLNEIDYSQLVSNFYKAAPKGHMITILDCCYASGMVDNFTQQTDFHTVIAASSEYSKAYYKDNSYFFTALRNNWNAETLAALKNGIELEMRKAPNGQKCAISIALNFTTSSLNHKI